MKNPIKILVILLCLFSIIFTLRSLEKTILTTAPDFGVLWTSAHDLINHKNPYADPLLFTINAYPPTTLVFYIPFAMLQYRVAQVIFIILSFLSLAVVIFISLKILVKKSNLYLFLTGLSLALLSFPTKFTFGMGQINLIAFFVVILSYYFYKRGKMEISGLILSLAYLLKPVLIFMLLFFILKRRWRVVLYSLIVPISATLLISLVYGVGSFLYWINEVVPRLSAISGREIYYNQGVMGFMSRLSSNFEVRKYLTAITSILLILYSSYLILKKKNENLQFSLLFVTLLLVDTLSWQHHFVWLIFPFIVLANYAIKLRRAWFWTLLGLAYLLVSWNFKDPQIFSGFPISLALSNTFYGALVLYLLNIYLLDRR